MILFNRYKNTQVEKVDNITVKLTSTMCDTFHEINMVMLVDLNKAIVMDAKVEFLRQPDAICTETAKLADKLIGLNLGPGLTKRVKEVVGGPSGCTHLMDLVLEAAKSFLQGKFRIEFEAIQDRNEARKDLDRKLQGNCWYHTRHMR